MHKAISQKLKEAMLSVLPVAGLVLIAALTPFADFSLREVLLFCISAIYMVIGIALFNLGADMAMTPMGELIGSGLTRSRRLTVLLTVCFLMGVLITVAEPDLSLLAEQVSAVMNGTLLIGVVGVGVGIFLIVGIMKIVTRNDLSAILLFFYMAVFAAAALLIERGGGRFLSLSFDSGGVTTGPVTVPFIMALGVGIAQTVGGRNAEENSFGLIALCSVGPVLSMLILSCSAGGDLEYEVPDYAFPSDVSQSLEEAIIGASSDVFRALFLIVAAFLVLNALILKLPSRKIGQIYIGIGYAFVGLVLFLSAVEFGFMPAGFALGSQIARRSPVFLVAFSFVIGMAVVLAEPAVHVLNHQVEEVTGGEVTRRQMMAALSLGVGVSIALSVIRVIFGFSLLYYLIPGYLLSLGLSLFVPRLYTAIAFDSGGVASGPLTSSFILPLLIGACVSINGADRVLDFAFGVVAMVAMTPLITIQSLSFRAILASRMRSKAAIKRILSADDAQIIYFNWEDRRA